MSSEVAVRICGVTKAFGDVTALQDIDLEVYPGEFVSLIGSSGCGKSTLLRVIGDLVQPTLGDVTVNGKAAHKARLDRALVRVRASAFIGGTDVWHVPSETGELHAARGELES
jgi:ABC-type Fe3+/spermidine/putrescine transport system ATPase subunit